MALFDRIFEYLDLDHEIEDAPDAVAIPHDGCMGGCEFDGVWFRYDTPAGERSGPVSPGDLELANEAPREWTLDDISLSIEPGQLAALVGPSGAGKTTMTYLVPRLYDVQRGSVKIDGIDVRQFEARVARRPHRRGHPGDVPVPYHDPPEPPVRQARGHGGGAGRGRPCREHPRPDRRAARRIRHRGRGARVQAVGRREAATGDRPGHPEGPQDPDPGRGDVVARHDVRAAGPGRPGPAHGGPNHDRDRPPTVDDPVRGRDLRRSTADTSSNGGRIPSCSGAAGSTPDCTSSSSVAAWSRPSPRTA